MTGQKRTEADSLTPKQAAFIAALMTSSTLEQAAEISGISARTGRRYLRNAAVKAALSAALDDAMGQAARRAVAAMTSAVDTLDGIHRDPAAVVGARVSAARAILEAGPKLREAMDLAERVAALEDKLRQGGEHGQVS